jgi:hypothetical protein
MADITLFVVLRGDSPESKHVFPVKAPNSTYVGEFKELVYGKLQDVLDGIGARNLVLWKVPKCPSSAFSCSDDFPNY